MDKIDINKIKENPASEQLNRKCYGIEISPEYCQVIIDRMKKSFPDIKVKKL